MRTLDRCTTLRVVRRCSSNVTSMPPASAAGRLGESSNGCAARLLTRRHRVLASCLLLGLMVGCSSDEPTAPVTQSVEASGGTKTPPPDVEQAATSESDEASDAAEAAESAFRTMTTQNVTPDEWTAANQTLQRIGSPALPTLVAGLKSAEQVQREMASSLLAEFGPVAEPAAQELIAALDDESTFVRANAATALLQMPDHVERIVPVLSEFLQSDDANLRRMAATNLAAIETDKARPLMPQLIAALDDEDRDVVYYSAQLLGRFGPEAADALPKLRQLKVSDDAAFESAVATAILQIAPESETADETP